MYSRTKLKIHIFIASLTGNLIGGLIVFIFWHKWGKQFADWFFSTIIVI